MAKNNKKRIRSISELLVESITGKLADDELAYVVQKLKACQPGNDENLWALIKTVGCAGASQYRKLIESFLHYPSMPFAACTALRVLQCWGYIEAYREEIKKFTIGVEWDRDQEVRSTALQHAKYVLRQGRGFDLELLALLIYFFENPCGIVEEEATICEAICYGFGKDMQDILKNKKDLCIIEQAQALIRTQKIPLPIPLCRPNCYDEEYE